MPTSLSLIVFLLCMIGSVGARQRAQRPDTEQRRWALLSLLLSLLGLAAVLSSAWRTMNEHRRRAAPASVEAPAAPAVP